MKRYGILTALFFAGFIESCYAALPTGATLFDVNVPTLWGGSTVALTVLCLHSGADQNDYALSFRPDFAPFLPRRRIAGRFQNVLPGSDWDFKLDVGYIFPCTGNNVTLSYLNYHQGSSSLVTLNRFNGLILPTLSDKWPTVGTLTIANPLLSPSPLFFTVPPDLTLINGVNPNLTTAQCNVNHNVLDINYGQFINVGCNARLKFYSGLRYMSLKNQFNVIYSYLAVNPTEIFIPGSAVDSAIGVNFGADFTQTVFQTSKYQGVGPYFGTEFVYHLRWGFGFVTGIATSLLVGQIDSRLDERFTHLATATVVDSNIPGVDIATVFKTQTEEISRFSYPRACRLVPNLDGKIGLDYSYQYCNKRHTKITIEGGYRVNHFFNVVDRLSEVDIDAPTLRTRRTLSQHFEGLYLGIQVNG